MKNFAFSWPRAASAADEDRCLVLTSSGGSGHIQASKAKEAELSKKYPTTKLYIADIMLDWLGETFGNFLSRKWNRAQKRGDLVSLEFYILCQWTADWLICIPVFFAALRYLSVNKITWVIDTQNMGMSSLLKAIRFIQFLTGRKITYEKVITDLPTEAATHFFKPIRRLSNKDRALVNLVTTKPLIGNENEEKFWKRSCKLPMTKVRYEPLPVRPSFKKHSDLNRDESLPLTFALNHVSEPKLLKKAFAQGSLDTTFSTNTFSLTIPADHKVSMLMLGANPHEEAFLSYVSHFIEIVKRQKYQDRKDDLFVFCNEYTEKSTSLMEKVVDLIENVPDFPSSLTIIPLSYQNDEVIAPLFYRSDATITRSGGLTSMEILSACHGQIWIHKGSCPHFFPKILHRFKTLREGMPPWEKGNAEYLMAKKGALFVTPDTFSELSCEYFS